MEVLLFLPLSPNISSFPSSVVRAGMVLLREISTSMSILRSVFLLIVLTKLGRVVHKSSGKGVHYPSN